jgi:hypothetical protein
MGAQQRLDVEHISICHSPDGQRGWQPADRKTEQRIVINRTG